VIASINDKSFLTEEFQMKKVSRSTAFILLMLVAALALAACGGGAATTSQKLAAPKGDAVKGKAVFEGTCISCHGPDAKGLPGLGKDLTTSEFVAGQTDDQLLAFVKKGRPATDPANTNKVDMPPRGGNPALTDTDLVNVVAFVRSIHQK
jgi:mono/diheme cytochrome c family protein